VTDEVNDAFERFCEHHEEMYQDRLAAGCTGQDILTIWINAELNGEKLDESQLLFEHVLLNTGGAETTRSAIAGGLERLSNDPKQYDALHEDPSLIPNAVEEILRWVCPFINMYRTATRDYDLHGKVIKEGQQVGLTYPAANRDPRHFKDPHTFNIFRDFSKESKHLSFGLGPHFCLGASLARMEIRLSLEEMTQRVKRIRIPEGKDVEYVSSSFTRGLTNYPAILEPR
jgi:cytochrome P450 family 142 subfamily A polypeptide 1